MSKKRKSLKVPRATAFKDQQGKCYYCEFPIWNERPNKFIQQYGLSIAQASDLQCTGEHLRSKCNGGEDSGANIVAACLFCNSRRHRSRNVLPPRKYRNFVRSRVAAGRWNSQYFKGDFTTHAIG